MKKLSLDLNLEGLDLTQQDKEMSNLEMATRIMSNIIISWAQDQKGLTYHDQRKYNKVMDALEAAAKAGSKEVELEDDQFGFLRKATLDAKMLPSKIVNRTYDLIDAVKYD